MNRFKFFATALLLLIGAQTFDARPLPADDCPAVMAADVFRHFDEYGNIRFEDEKARLDNFAIAIQAEPGATGYIVVHGPRTRPNRAFNRAKRAKRYLMNVRGFKDKQIVLLDARESDEMSFVLWIVPKGAVPPSGKPF